MNPNFSLDDRWWLRFQPDIHEKNFDCQYYSSRTFSLDDSADNKLYSDFSSCTDSESSDCSTVRTTEYGKAETVCRSVSKSLNCMPLTSRIDDNVSKKAKLMDAVSFEGSIDNYLNSMRPCERTGIEWRKADHKELASIVAEKSAAHLQNCDLPPPQSGLTTKAPKLGSCLSKELDMPDNQILEFTCHSRSRSQRMEKGLNSGLTSGHHYSSSVASESHGTQASEKPSSADFQPKTRGMGDIQSPEADDMKKSELLDALRHSQTRAREAERVAAAAVTDREKLISLFLKEASYHYVYRQWVRLLEVEVTFLRLQLNAFQTNCSFKSQEFKETSNNKDFVKEKSEKIHSDSRDGKKRPKNQKDPGTNMNWGIAVTLGLSLAGAGLILGWSMGWIYPKL